MRAKIIWVNGGIMAVVTLITFFLVRSSLVGLLSNPSEVARDATRAAQAAETRLSLDASRTERWVARQAAGEEAILVYSAGLETARQDRATSTANRIKDVAQQDPIFHGLPPSLVLFVDAEGVGIGRNGSALMRGEAIGQAYPGLQKAIAAGEPASDLWVNQTRQEQFAVSYAPVKDSSGAVLGALVIGTAIHDERLRTISETTSGAPLALVLLDPAVPSPIAVSTPTGFEASVFGPILSALRGGGAGSSQTAGHAVYSARTIEGYGDTKAIIVANISTRGSESIEAVVWPIFLSGALGILLVVIGGVLLGNYISKPIAEIEEGLLLLINGHRDLRFDLEHDELGGLTSRINALLNALLDVDEGSEDDAPRPSQE